MASFQFIVKLNKPASIQALIQAEKDWQEKFDVGGNISITEVEDYNVSEDLISIGKQPLYTDWNFITVNGLVYFDPGILTEPKFNDFHREIKQYFVDKGYEVEDYEWKGTLGSS